ncbi:MAG: HTH domain-containing protein [archaeon]
MGQEQVYHFLQNNRTTWYTTKDIATKLDASVGSVTTNLKKLRDSGQVEYKSSDMRVSQFLYKWKKP